MLTSTFCAVGSRSCARCRSRAGTVSAKSTQVRVGSTVFVSDELSGILAQHVEHHVSPDGWLLTGATGRPIAPTSVNSWWMRTTRAASVEGVTIHSLRHYFASGLIVEGCDVVTVQRALGHQSPSVTLDTYSHLWPKAEIRLARRQAAWLPSRSLALGFPAD